MISSFVFRNDGGRVHSIYGGHRTKFSMSVLFWELRCIIKVLSSGLITAIIQDRDRVKGSKAVGLWMKPCLGWRTRVSFKTNLRTIILADSHRSTRSHEHIRRKEVKEAVELLEQGGIDAQESAGGRRFSTN